MATCADVLENSDGDVSFGDDSANDSAYEGEGIVGGYLPKATSFIPDADELSGTEQSSFSLMSTVFI